MLKCLGPGARVIAKKSNEAIVSTGALKLDKNSKIRNSLHCGAFHFSYTANFRSLNFVFFFVVVSRQVGKMARINLQLNQSTLRLENNARK